MGQHCRILIKKSCLLQSTKINACQLHIHLTEMVHQASNTRGATDSFSFPLHCPGVI